MTKTSAQTETLETLTFSEFSRVLDSMPRAERIALINHIESEHDAGVVHARIAHEAPIEWSSFGVTPAVVLAILEDPT